MDKIDMDDYRIVIDHTDENGERGDTVIPLVKLCWSCRDSSGYIRKDISI